MKKLMIAAAIVCAAAVSQAATFTWGSSTAYGPAVANLTVVGTHAPGTTNADKLMIETMQKSITWSALMTLDSDLGKDSFEFKPTVSATVSGKNLSSSVVANGTDDNPVNVIAKVVLKGEYTIDNVKYTITSNELVAEGSFKELTTLAFSAPAAESWTVAKAVPEPTSGLLLLLGVAGLALRRRRA